MSIKEQTNLNPSQLQQRLWVREQEINALKVQNRHLITKLEDAEKSHRPYQINTQVVASEVEHHIRPVLDEIEKSLKTAFEMIQGTLRGVYQQSQRAQTAVEEMQSFSKELEMRVQDQRKGDLTYFHEKIFGSVTSFCDRIERQIDNRLKALSAIEVMSSKHNEVLNDMDQVKTMVMHVQKNSESTRGDVGRMVTESAEINQKMVEVQIQTRNAEEISRDGLQQIQNHRSEFKILRGEIRAMTESLQKLAEQVAQVEGSVQTSNVAQSVATLKETINPAELNLADFQNEDLESLERAIDAGNLEASQEDLTVILDLLKTQKKTAKSEAKKSEGFLRSIRLRSGSSLSRETKESRTDEPKINEKMNDQINEVVETKMNQDSNDASASGANR